MTSYWQLLQLILPVFAIIGAGVALRRAQWLSADADESLLKLVVKFLYPCLILDSVLGNAALRVPANLLVPPVVAFATISLGMGAAWWAARALGIRRGGGLRTFAFATGMFNYAYIPIPLMAALYGRESLGVLLVYNVGCEAAIWTVGILLLAGLSLRDGWRQLLNPPVWALLLGIALNESGLAPKVPAFLLTAVGLCAKCAIPLGLLLIGATLEELIREEPASLVDAAVTPAACALRLGLFPLALLLLTRILPVTPELKRVMVVQASMPAGILSIVIAKHYGGRHQTAAQVVLATNLLGLVAIPLWLGLGLAWVGP